MKDFDHIGVQPWDFNVSRGEDRMRKRFSHRLGNREKKLFIGLVKKINKACKLNDLVDVSII